MSDVAANPNAEPSAPQGDISELARQVAQLIASDRAGGVMLPDVERVKPRKPRAPLLSPKIKAALWQTLALWPLLVINAVLLWAALVVFHDGPSAEFVERITRIVQLASIALVFDVWLHPMQHPDTLEGPAQGARQYQRIYLIGIFVVAGCLAL